MLTKSKALADLEKVFRSWEREEVENNDVIHALSRYFNEATPAPKAPPKKGGVRYSIAGPLVATRFASKGAATTAFNRYVDQNDAPLGLRCEIDRDGRYGTHFIVRVYEHDVAGTGYLLRLP